MMRLRLNIVSVVIIMSQLNYQITYIFTILSV